MPFGRAACVLLLATGLSAQSRPAVSTPAVQSYRIAGIVVNSLTGQPLPAVSVAIAPTTPEGSNREVSQDIVTGDDGRFAFTGLTRGKYSLMAAARGFALQSFEHHDAYATAIAVGPDLDSENLVFRMDPDASIEGQVSDESNEPIQYATVRLFEKRIGDGQQRIFSINQAQTDDQGRFRMGHLAAGTYYLAASARPWYAQNDRSASQRAVNSDAQARAAQDAAALDVTYPLTFYPDSPDSAGASPIVLHPGERATADVVMRAVPALHLRIHTGSGPSLAAGRMAFPRVSQHIFEGFLEPVSNSPVSRNEPDVLQVMGLAPGHYVIEMSASGPDDAKSASRGWYREIDLVGDADLNAGEAPGFVKISGSVSFEGTTSVPKGSSIVLSNPSTGENFAAPLSDRGQFDFKADAVRPGRYNLLLGEDKGSFSASYRSRARSSLAARSTSRALAVRVLSAWQPAVSDKWTASHSAMGRLSPAPWSSSFHMIPRTTRRCFAATRATAMARLLCPTLCPATTRSSRLRTAGTWSGAILLCFNLT